MSKRSKQRKIAVAMDFESTTLVGENVSIATLSNDGEFVAIGEAKRAPGDVWNSDTGADLALGRALVKAGQILLDRAGVKA